MILKSIFYNCIKPYNLSQQFQTKNYFYAKAVEINSHVQQFVGIVILSKCMLMFLISNHLIIEPTRLVDLNQILIKIQM
jgi:hypothetical protein